MYRIESFGNPSSAASNASKPRIQASQLDVVVSELPGRRYVLLEASDGNQLYAGNNRFKVIVDIHAKRFTIHYSLNNQRECDKVVAEVQDAVRCSLGGGTRSADGSNQGRFLVQKTSASGDPNGNNDNGSESEWRELDEDSRKELILHTLKSRTVEMRKNLFEPEKISDGTGSAINSRRGLSRSMSEGAIHKLLNSQEILGEASLEPLSMRTNSTVLVEGWEADFFKDMGSLDLKDDDDDSRINKKRGRTRSLLRRSASFDSSFLDKKKIAKPYPGNLSPSRDESSFILSNNNDNNEFSISQSKANPTPNLLSRAVDFPVNIVSRIMSGSRILDPIDMDTETKVSAPRGLDIVFSEDCKTLSTFSGMFGNNRLRVSVQMQRKRFLSLSSPKQQEVATDLLATIRRDWKGRVLVQRGFSYHLLNQKDATSSIRGLLHGGHNKSGSLPSPAKAAATTAATPTTANTTKKSSLLAAAPRVPNFLQAASNAILNDGREKSFSELTTSERQRGAIEALKARAKEK